MDTNREWVDRARAVMPWGSSTCSKAPQWMPEEPGAIVRGAGCRVWDVDGREFIDYRNALGPVSLGYAYPDVNAAVSRQLKDGIVFGHPHPLECSVAERLVDVLPCAERVRFLKTGGEAVAACIRLARFFTGRDHVAQIGYNGWLNSLAARGAALPGQAASGVPPGVPAALAALHHALPWNDADALAGFLESFGDRLAALVVAAGYPDMAAAETFLPKVRELADRYGVVLIFDEIVTGFRVALGGVQEYADVLPDLAVWAKGIANGMPISVYGGRAEIMDRLDTVIVSSTYGGETLSLAAVAATLEVYRKADVIGVLWRRGDQLREGLRRIMQRYDLPVSVNGLPPLLTLGFGGDAPAALRERFFRAAYAQGISLYNVIYVNYSHHAADIDETIERLDVVAESIAAGR